MTPEQIQQDRETIAEFSPTEECNSEQFPGSVKHTKLLLDANLGARARTRWPVALDEAEKVPGLEAQIDMLHDLRQRREAEIERLREENQDLEAELTDKDGIFNRNCELSQETVPKLQAEIERLRGLLKRIHDEEWVANPAWRSEIRAALAEPGAKEKA